MSGFQIIQFERSDTNRSEENFLDDICILWLNEWKVTSFGLFFCYFYSSTSAKTDFVASKGEQHGVIIINSVSNEY